MKDNYAKLNNTCLVILTGVAGMAALSYMKAALVPLVFSIFAYAIVLPFVKCFQRHLHFPRWLSVVLTIFIFLLGSALLIFFISNSIGSFLQSTDVYRQKITEFINYLINLTDQSGAVFHHVDILERLKGLPFLSWASGLTGSLLSIIVNLALIIIFTLFLIAGEGSGVAKNPMLLEIQTKISRYVGIKFLTSFATGLLVGVILISSGVQLAIMFSVLTIILNFVPSIGSIIATLLPLPVIILQFGFGVRFIVVLALLSALQLIIGNVLEPRLMGERMDLHPVTVLVSLIFWCLVWGIPGTFLAVPITAVLKIILSRIEATKVLSELLAGRLPN